MCVVALVCTGSARPLINHGYYFCIMQELIVIDDLLSALVGIEGRYISIRRVHGKDDTASFQVDASMDLALQVRTLLHCFSFSNGISIFAPLASTGDLSSWPALGTLLI